MKGLEGRGSALPAAYMHTLCMAAIAPAFAVGLFLVRFTPARLCPFLPTGVVMAVLWYGAQLVIAGQLTAGALSAFVVYALFVATNAGALLGIASSVVQVGWGEGGGTGGLESGQRLACTRAARCALVWDVATGEEPH